jgi:hypothetical protein
MALVWNLQPDPRPFGDMRLLAQLLSGRWIDASHASYASVPLQEEELRRVWRTLRAHYPHDFAAAPPGPGGSAPAERARIRSGSAVRLPRSLSRRSARAAAVQGRQ